MNDDDRAGFAELMKPHAEVLALLPKPTNPHDADPLTWIVGAQNVEGQEL